MKLYTKETTITPLEALSKLYQSAYDLHEEYGCGYYGEIDKYFEIVAKKLAKLENIKELNKDLIIKLKETEQENQRLKMVEDLFTFYSLSKEKHIDEPTANIKENELETIIMYMEKMFSKLENIEYLFKKKLYF